MTVSPTPVFTQGVQSAQCVCTAAKTTYNDGTNAVLLMTAGANGAVVYALRAIARGALAAANKLQLYRSPDAGVTFNLIQTPVMPAYTPDAATTGALPTDFGFTENLPLRLGPNERLYAGIYTAQAGGIVFDVQYENL